MPLFGYKKTMILVWKRKLIIRLRPSKAFRLLKIRKKFHSHAIDIESYELRLVLLTKYNACMRSRDTLYNNDI